jgi:hypothetical protein
MKFKICSRIARSARIPSLSLLASVREKSFDSHCRTKNQTTFRIAKVSKAEIRHPKSEMHPFTLFMNVHTIFMGGRGASSRPTRNPSLPLLPPVKMMLEEPRSILILQILLILSKNPLLWNFYTWWRMQFMKTSVRRFHVLLSKTKSPFAIRHSKLPPPFTLFLRSSTLFYAIFLEGRGDSCFASGDCGGCRHHTGFGSIHHRNLGSVVA